MKCKVKRAIVNLGVGRILTGREEKLQFLEDLTKDCVLYNKAELWSESFLSMSRDLMKKLEIIVLTVKKDQIKIFVSKVLDTTCR